MANGGSKVLSCVASCKSDYQDKKYGDGKRLMNRKNQGYRCTVCGKDKAA